MGGGVAFFEYEYEYRPPGRTEYEYEVGRVCVFRARAQIPQSAICSTSGWVCPLTPDPSPPVGARGGRVFGVRFGELRTGVCGWFSL